MSNLRKIVVFTATGDQGGSVAKYLVKDGRYEVVGITRNPESESAKAMSALGVKMVKGDLEDVESYTPALEGLYGAFVNADFWVKFWANGNNGPEAGEWEYGLATKAIEACAKAGAKHIVYSTLDDIPYVPHMVWKNKVSHWADKKGYPVTHLLTSHYMNNLTKFPGLFNPQDDGSIQLAFPTPDDTIIPNFAVEQTGGWVEAIFNDSDKYKGKWVEACGENLTLKEWAKSISEVTGKKVTTLGLPPAIFDDKTDMMKNGVPEELLLNYECFYKRDFKRDVAASKAIYPEQWTTVEWAKETGKLQKYTA